MEFHERLRIKFPLFGDAVAVDHGESLYSAISHHFKEFHELDGLVISPILGGFVEDGRIHLDRGTHFFMQVPNEYMGKAIQLAGKQLELRKKRIRVGPPQLTTIYPSENLYSHYVTIRNSFEPEKMKIKIQEELDRKGVKSGEVHVIHWKIRHIHDKKILGFNVGISGLNEQDSILIQQSGIGGRRRYTAGVFLPVKHAWWLE